MLPAAKFSHLTSCLSFQGLLSAYSILIYNSLPMTHPDIRRLQAPLKEKYKSDPGAAFYMLHAEGILGDDFSCKVISRKPVDTAGQHPATGGNGEYLCSGDMLLEALVACAGVTLNAVAAAMHIQLDKALVRAEGDLDFRGTLGMAKDVPVGFSAIRLFFDVHTGAPPDRVARLVELTENYCVIYQTLRSQVSIAVNHAIL